jgi:hypothetical protein
MAAAALLIPTCDRPADDVASQLLAGWGAALAARPRDERIDLARKRLAWVNSTVEALYSQNPHVSKRAADELFRASLTTFQIPKIQEWLRGVIETGEVRL